MMDEMERHKELLEIIKPPTKEQLEKAEERHEFFKRIKKRGLD